MTRYTFWHYLGKCVLVDGQTLCLSKMENELFFLLYVNMGRRLHMKFIINALYGHRPDGGPLWAHHMISIYAMKLRTKTGLTIAGTWQPGLVLYEPMRVAA